MKITDVTAIVHEVPIDLPLLESPFQERSIVFVRVETSDGTTGYGETGYLNPAATAAYIERDIANEIIGMDPLRTTQIWERLYASLNPRSQTGVWSTAVSAVDIALWDIKGKVYREPVWRLLGGSTDTVQSYVTFGFPEYDTDQLVTLAKWFVDDGHTRLKMVVGRGDNATPRTDESRIRAVRSAVGDEVELLIDANYQYSFEEALELCNRIEDLHIGWFEEPVYGNDPELLSKLQRRTHIPIAAGQNEGLSFHHRDLIQRDAIDVSHPNVCFVGGFTEAKRTAALARTHNMRVAHAGGWPYHNMHLLGGIANGSLLEFHLTIWDANEKMYESILNPTNGTVTLPDAPGLGLEPKAELLDELDRDSNC